MNDYFCLSMQDKVVELNITSLAVLSIPEISNLRLLDGLNKSLRVSTLFAMGANGYFNVFH